MKWFSNAKIRTKIIAGFLIVALIAGAIGLVGITNITTIDNLDTQLYEKITVPLGDMVTVVSAFQRLRGNVKDVILSKKEVEILDYETRISERWMEFHTALDNFSKTLLTEEGKTLYSNLKSNADVYAGIVTEIIAEVRSGNLEAAMKLNYGEGNDIRTLIETDYDRLSTTKTDLGKKTSDGNTATAQTATLTMIIILIGGIILAMLIGLLIANSISKPLGKGLNMIQQMGKGKLNTRLNLKNKDEVGQMAQAMDQFAEDLQVKIIKTMDKIATGDVSMELELLDKEDEITPALITTIKAVRALVVDANMLANAAIEGLLDTRADASKHQGEFANVVRGVNQTLDAVIKPVKEASAVLDEMSLGNLRKRVVGDYRGDHAKIKNSLNNTLNALEGYVQEISDTLNEMSDANLTVAISGDYLGDFAPIKSALNLIIDTFNQVLYDMNSAADQVAAGSSQVSDGSQALSSGATEQASSIEQLTASISEVSQQTKQNAMNANRASELASTAQVQATEGNRKMNDMQKAMEEINTSSNNISKIIKVIDEIAFQTNILALNAAVEAARAGQHGKGFAVVAEEVRNLAARSANAAKETTEMIEGSIIKVAVGTKIADDTAKALEQIVQDVAQATTLVGSIASASNEQATAIAQITQGINQVSDVVQANSATAEESAASSEELSGQALILKEMIGKFKIKRHIQAAAESYAPKAKSNAAPKQALKKSTISLSDSEFSKF